MLSYLIKKFIITSFLLLIFMVGHVNSTEQHQGVETMGITKQGNVVTELNLLFLGNSHTRNHNVPEIVKVMIISVLPKVKVDYDIAPGIKFLDERLHDSRTRKLFEKKQFSHIILQAQKYSQSRRRNYSTKEAEQWVTMAQNRSIIAILFPEWGQRGRQWEGEYVHGIYEKISKKTSACIAPVGLVWDEVLTKKRIAMHASDGNHANRTGAFLSALVLFESITGIAADKIPYLKAFDVSEEMQSFLRDAVTQTLFTKGACT